MYIKNKSFLTNLNNNPLIILITALSAIIAIIAFFVGSPFERSKENNVQINAIKQIPGVPPPPPDIEKHILQEKELFQGGYGISTGCFPEGNMHTVTLINAENVGNSNYLNSFILMDDKQVQLHYYIENTLSHASYSWIPHIMIPGRRLNIKYAQCGNEPIRILTYIEPLPANKL